jgi:Flp pilus assembly protein TadB
VTAAQVLGGAAALLVVIGITTAVAGLRGWGSPVAGPGWAEARLHRGRWIRWALAAASGALAWLLTGWPALAVGAAGAVIGLPAIAGAGSRAEAQIERVEAVEEWARRVADVVAIGVGLEQALLTAARTAPAAISGEAATLAARIAARTSTEQALRRFADELADPTADLVVAALILATRRRGPGVAVALTAIAESVGEEVAARRRVEADRAKPRATARAVTAITVLIIGVGLLNRGYTDPYGTAVGQVVLIGTLGFFAAALWWMHSMTTTTAPARILAEAGESQR